MLKGLIPGGLLRVWVYSPKVVGVHVGAAWSSRSGWLTPSCTVVIVV
jgi:hypothetical protein